MRCDKVKRKLPLSAGGELDPETARRIKRHLASCPSCRKEYQQYIQARKQMQAWMDADSPEWDEAQWRRMVRSAAEGPSADKEKRFFLKPVWAAAVLFVAAAGLFLLLWLPQTSLFQGITSGSSEDASPWSVFMRDKDQEALTLTWVSPETGLKIKWFVKKDFNLKEMNP